MTWTDGSLYLGEWRRGIQHGIGRMEFPDGSVKMGYFKNNIFERESSDEDAMRVKIDLIGEHVQKMEGEFR